MTYPNPRHSYTSDSYDSHQRTPAPVADPLTPIEQGSLKFLNEEKGYGFLVTETGDLFVHISAFQRANIEVPPKGTIVRFQRGRSRDGRELALVIHP